MNNAAPYVALLIGASRGIGAACAYAFAARGAQVCLTARNAARLNAVKGSVQARGHSVWAQPSDITDADQMQTVVNAAVAEFGRVDTVINFAAATGPLDRPSWEVAQKDWEAAVSTNMTGTYNVIRATLPTLQKQGRGALLFASSPFGDSVQTGMGAYAASRAGAHALVRQTAAELSGTEIGACLVFPGKTETDGLADFRRARGGAGSAAPVASAEVMANLFVWAAMQSPWDINGADLSWSDPQVRNSAMSLGAA
ncbi:SDR family NAD(P)-dependent oxidoreductase [Actibacterium lipolyticum]|uniref:3-oxoacyl-[acyl-carrier-protein] reductase FabG n=1 Tax=Actibacterium lipolyticum TaxID=1524263 RepID=A0A238JX57_9RHOB|nr:SDR family oxidoreductase [Actibacterium lipolyticum]SMX34744.1 3-oxoacyl-[acyl-carrier-protein] reductase FabG [Actibacterium lipolyticum]